MARRPEDGWQGPESPQIVTKTVLTQEAEETDRASAGGTARGKTTWHLLAKAQKTSYFNSRMNI